MKFTVSLCVYYKDEPVYFKEALHSIVKQTLLPAQIVVVVDGEVGKELHKIIDDFKQYASRLSIEYDVEHLSQNLGHGKARKISIEKAKYDLVALMDADDISRSYRFQKQIEVFEKNPSLSIVGGQIMEIEHDTKKEIGKRIVPQSDEKIKEYMKLRCPFNQMTVMFKKNDVIQAGNYQDFFHNEDYYLWIRMYLQGFSFYNINDILVDVRLNESFYSRRGGWRYFVSEYKIQHFMYKNRIILYPRYIFNIAIRFILQIVLTEAMRGYIFKKLARKRV
jgi:glycosyltransferase involved in cell wall biosynthesis